MMTTTPEGVPVLAVLHEGEHVLTVHEVTLLGVPRA